VFSFEGIGLVIPITDAMREPHKFPKVLTGVMLFLTVLFSGAGALSYAIYGFEIKTVVITNLPQDKKFVQVVQFLYAVAILLSMPLQLFPALRIMENWLFTKSGKHNAMVKWEKNGFRFVTVIVCALVSWGGAKDLDKFVAFVGSFACIPLCYVYPAMLHYRACARTRWQKTCDILLMFFGLLAAVYTTVQTVKLMLEPGQPTPIGQCPTHEP
jgi:proton-coupled amino acid transporter